MLLLGLGNAVQPFPHKHVRYEPDLPAMTMIPSQSLLKC